MTELHSTEVEIIAEAHRYLVQGGTVMKTGADACADELQEIIQESDSVPGPVARAHAALVQKSPDVHTAKSELETVLSETAWDPNDSDSYYPD